MTLPRAIDMFVYHKYRDHNNIYIIINIILRYLIQIIILFVLNVGLIQAIRQAGLKHTSLTGTKQATNKSVTINLIVVVIIFLICGTCRGTFYVLYNGFPQVFPNQVVTKLCNMVSKILMTINSSVNFLVYCMFYKRFRYKYFLSLSEG